MKKKLILKRFLNSFIAITLVVLFYFLISPSTLLINAENSPECSSLPNYWNGQFVNNWESSFNLQNTGKFYESNRSLVVKDGKNALETVFNSGSYGVNEPNIPIGGTGFKANVFNNGVEEACFTFYQYLEPGFDFKKGGKLPGLYGGVGNTGGNVPNGTDGFSTRLMWRSQGQGQVYAYMPSSVNFGTQLGTGSWTFETGKWQKISQYLKLNTPNANNGKVTMWIDGVEKFSVANLNFRSTTNLKIDGVIGHTFFGGNDSSWASPKTQKLWWADFGVKTSNPNNSSISSSLISTPSQTTPLSIKVNLQGVYNTGAGLMRTDLKTKNALPLNQPYNNTIFNYPGLETTTLATMPANAVDWILLEFKNPTTGLITARKAALLKADGIVVNSDGTSLTIPNSFTAGNYNLIIRHRNHLAISTNTPLSIVLGSPVNIDLTTNSNVKGSNQVAITPGIFGLKRGNANGNNSLNALDRVIVRSTNDQINTYNRSDINMDSNISSTDRVISRGVTDGVENV